MITVWVNQTPFSQISRIFFKKDPFFPKIADMRILPSKAPISANFETLMRTPQPTDCGDWAGNQGPPALSPFLSATSSNVLLATSSNVLLCNLSYMKLNSSFRKLCCESVFKLSSLEEFELYKSKAGE